MIMTPLPCFVFANLPKTLGNSGQLTFSATSKKCSHQQINIMCYCFFEW